MFSSRKRRFNENVSRASAGWGHSEDSSTLQAPAALGVGDRVVEMRVFNVSAPKGFQRRSKLEKGMRDWFDNGEDTTNKCVLCGPGGIGKSTLVCMHICICMYFVCI